MRKVQIASAAAFLMAAAAMAPVGYSPSTRQTNAAPPRPRRPAVIDDRPALAREIAEHNAAVEAKRQAKKLRKAQQEPTR